MGESPLPEAKQVNQGPIRRTPRRVMHSLMVLSACEVRIEREFRPPPAQLFAKTLRMNRTRFVWRGVAVRIRLRFRSVRRLNAQVLKPLSLMLVVTAGSFQLQDTRRS
jgi:hypothetical protein